MSDSTQGVKSSNSYSLISPINIRHCTDHLFIYIRTATVSDDDIEIGNRRTPSLTIVLTGLHKYTNYTLKVAAFTRIGTGENSKPITCCTEQDGIRSAQKISTDPKTIML